MFTWIYFIGIARDSIEKFWIVTLIAFTGIIVGMTIVSTASGFTSNNEMKFQMLANYMYLGAGLTPAGNYLAA